MRPNDLSGFLALLIGAVAATAVMYYGNSFALYLVVFGALGALHFSLIYAAGIIAGSIEKASQAIENASQSVAKQIVESIDDAVSADDVDEDIVS